MSGGNSRDRRKRRRARGPALTEVNPEEQLTARPAKTPSAAKLIHGLSASGGFVLFIGALYEYWSLAGVVNMTLARIVLVFAGLVGLASVVSSEPWWGKTRKQKMTVTAVTALILSVGLWRLDAWTANHRSTQIVSNSASAPSQTGGAFHVGNGTSLTVHDVMVVGSPSAPIISAGNSSKIDAYNIGVRYSGSHPLTGETKAVAEKVVANIVIEYKKSHGGRAPSIEWINEKLKQNGEGFHIEP